MLKNHIIIFILILPAFVSLGQDPVFKENSLYDDFVNFANESIHGMLIAHRLFENYNQDINKYVDLPGHPLNFYNNTDLPQDIFDDPEHWFYEVSPKQLYQEIRENLSLLPAEQFGNFQQNLDNIRQTTLKSNQLRLFIGEAINSRDLTNKDTLYTIYELLEQAVDAYDLFSAELVILQNQLDRAGENLSGVPDKYEPLTSILTDIHRQTTVLLQSIKTEDDDMVINSIKDLQSAEKSFRAFSIQTSGGFISTGYVRARTRILNNLDQILLEASSYLNKESIPEEYALYGAAYYYYNTQIINKVNRYGNGMVQAINQMIDLLKLPLTHRLEIPHYLTIIYPQKVEKQLPVIESSVHEILTTPETLENRTVVVSDNMHVIHVDTAKPTLEIFDHLKQDGDIISLNFNGDWIFRNLSLERKPRSFILKLNPTGKNYLILHAENEGSVPPNTIGINYIDEGRRKRYIMQSNLKTSQMVEVIMNK